MRLLLDQGLPRSAAKFLREAGIDTVHVGEVGCADADDAAILQKAQGEKRTVVTLDADFHALLALSRATLPSVIRIRMEGLYGEQAADLIKTVLAHCSDDLERGAMVTVQRKRIRIRRLPLLP